MRPILLTLTLLIVSCDSSHDEFIMRLNRDGHSWAEPAIFKFQPVFDGIETRVLAVIYSEKSIANDSIDSYLITFPRPIGELSPGDEFSLTDSTFFPRKLVYWRRHASQDISIVGINAKSGIVKINHVKYDTTNLIFGLEGRFNAVLSDSSKITNGYFKAQIDIDY